ncbi:MAG TPA: WecB/TagA/CpsF family glycosyltransferase [Caldilineaceae bacterium]|nr:WecB/TagA/CpsF family glycosyltransferase [Caldilineaceae bacterium]
MTGVLDPIHAYRLNRLDLALPDGQPVRWALNWLYGTNLPDRVYGPNLALKLCERLAAEGLPLYLYGSKHEVLDRLAANMTGRFPRLQIAGMQPSKFRQLSIEEKAQVVEAIRASGARLVFVGLGCPRQEVWVYEHLACLTMPLVAVGAAFDFHAGTQKQAPEWLQRMGLEWLYRLVHEPRRLWKRYLLLNPHYVYLVLLQWLRLRSFPVLVSQPPQDELRYG